MKIMELAEKTFDDYGLRNRFGNIHQTSSYGVFKKRLGFDVIYLGLINDNYELLGATMIVTDNNKSLLGNIKYAYAPGGFIIDYNNFDLLQSFTYLLKEYLKTKGITYLRINPLIIKSLRNNDGSTKKEFINNNNVINKLKLLHFSHLGYNINFETNQPRFNVILDINKPSEELYKLMTKDNRNKIRRAQKMGITIHEGNLEHLPIFYKFVMKKRNKDYQYYQNLFEAFKENDNISLYFAKLNPTIYLKNVKIKYEQEQIINNKLLRLISSNPNNQKIIKRKIHSDNLLDIYKNDIINASNLMTKYPKGICIGGTIIIRYGRQLLFWMDGYDTRFKNIPAGNLLKWQVILQHNKRGYTIANLNGITGVFDKNSKYYGLLDFKLGFGGEIVEYFGEMDLIIKEGMYGMFKTIPGLNQKYLINKF